MTTYLFIGLALLLAAYLVHARRGRGDDSPGRTRARGRPSRAPASSPTPTPAAVAAAESAAAHATPPRADAPLPSRPAPAMSWTPEETIVEPGWPLPGEISGGWSTAPSSPPATFTEPAAVVEWQPVEPSPAAGADAPAAEAELPGAEEWAMPALDATSADTGGSGPPLWTPDDPAAGTGAIDAAAIWIDESAAASALDDPGAVAWPPETTEAPDAPPLEWSTPDAVGATPDTPELAWAAGPSIAPEPEPAASVWEGSAGPEAETGPGITPEDVTATDPVDDAIATPAPAAVPEWIAAAAPEHAAFAASVFGEPAPAQPAGVEVPGLVGAAPEVSVPGSSRTEPPAPTPHEPVPAPPPAAAPLAGLVPLTSVCDHLGVTPRMLALMRILADTPMSVSELARALSVSRPLIADLCARLQAGGLAEREPDDSDRRRVRVVLTAAGHLLCAETAASPETGSYESVLARLSPAERAQLRGALDEMDGTPA